jgi:xanthine dehydrogenase molybdopterin-binding subunit B
MRTSAKMFVSQDSFAKPTWLLPLLLEDLEVFSCFSVFFFSFYSSSSFLGPQGMFVVEAWVDHIARELGISPELVRERNFIRTKEKTHYNQVMDESVIIADMFSKLRRESEFESRRKAIDEFNASNKDRKKGICLMPTVFGLSFTAKFLNQAGALIVVYTDGTVQINQSGTEMGQGLFTKMAQIASHALKVPIENVHVMETSTDKVTLRRHKTKGGFQLCVSGSQHFPYCRLSSNRH